MEAQINHQEIMRKLEKLQTQVNFLQESFEDSILTEDDIKALKLADQEFREGKTISHEKLKKELGL